MTPFSLVIFDLDGTLLDTAQGIGNSVRYAEEKLRLPPLPEELLKKFIGPPPLQMYRQMYRISDEMAQAAVAYHREYGKTKAIYEASVYAGMPELLAELKRRGMQLAVATLKGEKIAHAILEHFDLAQYFDLILGMDEQETRTKAEILMLCGKTLQVDPKQTVLIGDSPYDAAGAQQYGCDFIAALYGWGFESKESADEFAPFATISAPGKALNVLYSEGVS